MSNAHLAAPELAAIEIHGMTRASFMMKSALAAGAVYGGSVVTPFVSKALAQEGAGDVEILNFALTLEFLEATFYEQAGKQVKGLSGETKTLTKELESNEKEHVDALTQTITQLGGKPVEAPGVDFGNAFANEASYLKLAQTFEETGVSAYNGAATEIQSKEVLGAAGSIAQVEGRHAAVIRLQRDQNPAPRAFDETLSMDEVLKAVKPFVKQ